MKFNYSPTQTHLFRGLQHRLSTVFTALWLCLSAVGVSPHSAEAAEPTNANELAEKKAQAAAADAAADVKRKAAMSPDELAWEKILEANLGPFYLPIYKHEKAEGKETAWDYVKDDPTLPRVLLIGDSISRGYTLAVRHKLAGRMNVHRAPENCGATKNGLKKLDLWLGTNHWDAIHFNFGIHDRKTKPEEYEQNLILITERLQKTGAKIIWATTTPAPPGSKDIPDGNLESLNEIAAKVAKSHNLATDDLYSLMKPLLTKFQRPNDVHFDEGGYQYLGAQVVKSLEEALARH